MQVLGRSHDTGPYVELGAHRAPDGSDAAPIGLDLDTPHAGVIVGKRGAGKSHTVAVLAEGIAAADGVTGVVADPMGGLDTLATLPGAHQLDPTIAADALPPRAWCHLLELDTASPAGSLVWRVARDTTTLQAMIDAVHEVTADRATIRAAHNHLQTAAHWDIFAPNGLTPTDITTNDLSILNLTDLAYEPANAVVRAITDSLYTTALTTDDIPLPWILIDEAHAFVDGIAGPSINRILTRGRHPGISTILATQRPAALPPEAISQTDLQITHRLTATADLDALETARPTFLRESLRNRRPNHPGDALIVDDATEVARAITIRDRHTPDGGTSPTASNRAPPTTDTD